jgi:hypothetical protein
MSMTDSSDVPTTWTELLRTDLDLIEEGLDLISGVPAALERLDHSREPASLIGGPALTLAQAAVIKGPDACRSAIQILTPLLPRMMSDMSAGVDADNRVLTASILSFINTALCCGASPPADIVRTEADWVPQFVPLAAKLGEQRRHRLALASLAIGRVDLVPAFSGAASPPSAAAFSPGEVFAFNVTGFIRYLGSALEHSAPPEAVWPAWESFVDHFPHKLAAATLDWPDLLYATRVIVTRLEKGSVADSARALHMYVSGR